ncbi:MAG: VanZ family protein [Candidatus Aureabacteria bacterium]|nr:VanZ family protein [Candidatus Auribacterota bacterium]
MSRPYAFFAFVWAVVIFVAASVHVHPRVFMFFPHQDKLMHFIEYAILTFFIFKSFVHSSDLALAGRAVPFSLLLAIAYGGLIELYQYLLPYRTCELMDFVANSVGAIAVIIMESNSHG